MATSERGIYTCFTWGEDDNLIVEARVRREPRTRELPEEYFITELQVYDLSTREVLDLKQHPALDAELSAEAVRRVSEKRE